MASPAKACQALAEDEKDDASDPGTVAVRARVTSFEMLIEPGRWCQKISYDVLEPIQGTPPNPFVFESCAEGEGTEGLLEDETKRFMEEQLGFAKGAEVLAAYTTSPPKKGMRQKPQKSGQLRPVVWSCWGFYHFRIDKLSEAERRQAVEGFRADAAQKR